MVPILFLFIAVTTRISFIKVRGIFKKAKLFAMLNKAGEQVVKL